MLAKEMLWREKDKVKLSRYVRKFNTSITLMTEKNPEIADAGLLPQRLNVKEIRESGITRKDFNNLMRSIDRWFKKGSRDIIHKGGIPMTRWEYKEAIYATQRINAEKKKRRQKANKSLRQKQKVGEDLSAAVKLESLEDKVKEGAYDIENAVNSWKLFVQQVNAQSKEGYMDEKNAIYYDNYHTAIYENFSGLGAKIYADFLEDFRLSGEELFSLIGEYPALDIDYIYGPDEEENKLMYLLEMLPMGVEKVLGKDMLEAGMKRFYNRINNRGTPEERNLLNILMQDTNIKLG